MYKNKSGLLVLVLGAIIFLGGVVYFFYKQHKDLKQRLEQEKQLNKTKSKFIANMSHEIRTPLNAVVGFSQILEDQIADSTQQQYLKSIKTASHNLLNLINDVLDMAKIEVGMLEVKFNCFNLNDLLADLEVIFSQKIRGKGLEFKTEMNIDNLEVKLDQTRLRRVLVNLLDTAIEFTQEGYIKVIVNATKHGNDRLDLELIIEDTGSGIPQREQNKVLQSFNQRPGQNRGEYNGTGLGLIISKKITELMGGRIDIESSSEGGSKFSLNFSNLEFEELENEFNSFNYSTIEFEPAEVLVADDIESNRKFLKIKLAERGLEVSEAENGREALELIEKRQFDLLIMDLRMPVVDGYQALKEVRKLGYQLPVLALTAAVTVEEQDKAQEAGFNGFLTKPITEQQLFKKLAGYLEHSGQEVASKQRLEVNDAEINIKPEELASLEEEFLPQLERIKEAIIIGEVENLVSNLYQRGKSTQLSFLNNYAQRLEEQLELVAIDEIKTTISLLENSFKNLRNDLEQRGAKDDR